MAKKKEPKSPRAPRRSSIDPSPIDPSSIDPSPIDPSSIAHRPSPIDPPSSIAHRPSPIDPPLPIDILFVTSEMRPFARTGGLSDVSSALPRALARLGHRVTVVLPKYRGAQTDGAAGWPADIPFGLHAYPVRFVEQPLERRRHGRAHRRAAALRP